MTHDTTLEKLRRSPLTDDRDLVRFVGGMLHNAITTRLWVILLDDEMRSTDVILPLDDAPEDPRAVVAMLSSGPVRAAQMLGERVAKIIDHTPARAVAVVWERPGPPGASGDTLLWVGAMREAFARNPGALRAQLVLSDEGAHLIGEPVSKRAA